MNRRTMLHGARSANVWCKTAGRHTMWIRSRPLQQCAVPHGCGTDRSRKDAVELRGRSEDRLYGTPVACKLECERARPGQRPSLVCASAVSFWPVLHRWLASRRGPATSTFSWASSGSGSLATMNLWSPFLWTPLQKSRFLGSSACGRFKGSGRSGGAAAVSERMSNPACVRPFPRAACSCTMAGSSAC